MRSISLFVLFMTSVFYSQGQTTKRALFIGNFMTNDNEMPLMVQQIASSLDDSLYWLMNADDNSTLMLHASNSTTLDNIDDPEWDYVVLQDRQQYLSLTGAIADEYSAPFVQTLCQAIHDGAPCAQPVLFTPWPHKNGDPQNCADYSWVCDLNSQQDSITAHTLAMAIENQAWCSPVGEAWRIVQNLGDSNLGLYNGDPIAPSVLGTYLTACVFYSTLFGAPAIGAWHPDEISQEAAEIMQSVAADLAVFNSGQWNFQPLVWADMVFTDTGLFWNVVMQTSDAVDSVMVFDGMDSIIWSPGETGAFLFGPGFHYFQMEIYSGCGDLDDSDTLVIGEELVQSLNKYREIHAFPNPASDYVDLDVLLNSGLEIALFDQQGREVKRQVQAPVNGRSRILLNDLNPGIYIARFEYSGVICEVRIIKQE